MLKKWFIDPHNYWSGSISAPLVNWHDYLRCCVLWNSTVVAESFPVKCEVRQRGILGVVHKGRPHRGGVGQVGHLADGGGGGQGHADVRNASENRLENAENRVKIGRKSRENGQKIGWKQWKFGHFRHQCTLYWPVRYCYTSDAFREHLTNATNQCYIGQIDRSSSERVVGARPPPPLCGRPLWTTPKIRPDRPPATPDLWTSTGGGGGRPSGTLADRGGSKTAVFYGRPLWTAPYRHTCLLHMLTIGNLIHY